MKEQEPVIVLDEGARDGGLAEMLFNLLRQNLEQKPQKLSSFRALHSNVVIVARDIDITVTLAFKGGKLTIYNGIVGKPDLEIIADHDAILSTLVHKFANVFFLFASKRSIRNDINHGKGRHSCESRNPGKHWIPGQARNDKPHKTYLSSCITR